MDNPDQHPPSSNSSSLVEPDGPVSEYVQRHFRATLAYLQRRKDMTLAALTRGEVGPRYDEVDTSIAVGK